MNQQNYQWNSMTIGTCYYPEHWDRSLWQDDLQRMKEAGIEIIRVAEFSWSITEPEEGHFSFAFWDEFLELCLREKMKVIFSTPTATPPAWLTEKYPEVLNANEEGVLYRHGCRRHYNYNAEKYRELTARVVTKLAEHFGKHPAIIGWQIDNEFNCELNEYYAQADSEAFRVFLQEKYGTLDALNEAWGTVFWSQTYTAWEQIYVPRLIANEGYNPHMRLDYYRFISDSTLRYCKLQSDILRKYLAPGVFVTTNGLFSNMDNHKMAEEMLDVYTYDCYPSFAFGLDRKPKTSTDLNDRHWNRNLIEVRSICPHFGIMEQQSGGNGWTSRMAGPMPRPGQLTLWAMQSVAQGADFVSFFRWRTCTIGTEIYWHGILNYDNRDNRRLDEVKAFSQKMKAIDEVCGARFTAVFAMVKDYDNEWDAKIDAIHRDVAWPSEEAIFEAAEQSHTPFDMVFLNDDTEPEMLSRYPLLIYPHPVIMTERRASIMREYVEKGGTLIIGCRSGYKQENGKCVMMPQPGLLQSLTGTDVKDFTYCSPAEDDVSAVWLDGPLKNRKMQMPVFNDILDKAEQAQNVKILAKYSSSFYQGKAALTENTVGKGKVLHLGSAFDRENVKQLLSYTGVLDPFAQDLQAPEDVEVIQRTKDGMIYYFVLNFMSEPRRVSLKKNMVRLYDGAKVSGEQVLQAFETAVYRLQT